MRLKRNLSSEMHKICPRSCQYLMTTFDSYDSVPFAEGPGVLNMKFQRFIKVSESRVAYGGLELMAEVGGYVGLFQITNIIIKILGFVNAFIDRTRNY